MSHAPKIDRHVLPFKPTPFISAQRDIRFNLAGEDVYEVAYFFTFHGQVKEVKLSLNSLAVDQEKLQQKLVATQTSVAKAHLSVLSSEDGFVLFDFDMEVVVQVKIINGILDADAEAFSQQGAQMQMQLKMLKNDQQIKLLN